MHLRIRLSGASGQRDGQHLGLRSARADGNPPRRARPNPPRPPKWPKSGRFGARRCGIRRESPAPGADDRLRDGRAGHVAAHRDFGRVPRGFRSRWRRVWGSDTSKGCRRTGTSRARSSCPRSRCGRRTSASSTTPSM